MNGAKIVENIFFTVTCVSVFTCIIRSDYNFAMGLLSYYMIKNIGQNKASAEVSKIARTVSTLRSQLLTHSMHTLGDYADCHDHRYGLYLDLRDERCLVRQTP